MWTQYVVKQGDYLKKLAHRLGFDADAVWNDPRNEALKAARPSMDMLAPGDVLQIPVGKKEGLPFVPGRANRYVAAIPAVDVALAFREADGAPIANEPYEVRGLSAPLIGQTTDSDGMVTFKVPVTTREVTIVFPDRHFEYSARIGDLDPGSEASGVRQRLQNLGYLSPDSAPDQDEEAKLTEALLRFQHGSGLPPTGVLDDITRRALIDAHGL